MLKEIPILTIIILLPILGVIFNTLINKDLAEENSKKVSLWTSFVTLALSIFVACQFDHADGGFQFIEYTLINKLMGFEYHLGLDGISLWFVLLTNFLVSICILMSAYLIKVNVRFYMILLLMLQSFLLAAFCSLNLLMFFVAFEAVLIPMFFIIGVWGGERRIYATFKFFLYTMTGSILMLIGIVYLYTQGETLNYQDLLLLKLTDGQQKWLFLSFFFAFAIKTPMWPFHSWLPEAHVQAPTTGSMLLAGLLLKLGGYGFIRFALPLFPVGALYFSKPIMIISVIGLVYASLMAFAQKDMKKLIAYSSVAHMAVITLGIFTFNIFGLTGAIYQMIGHGLVSAGLFLCVGLVYFRFGSHRISDYGGLARMMPVYGVSFMLLTLAAIGLPLSIGFVAEFFIILGALKVGFVWTSLVALGVILSAVYMLSLYKNIGFGEMNTPHVQGGYDLKWYESFSLFSIVAIVLACGIHTFPTQSIEASLTPTVSKYLEAVK